VSNYTAPVADMCFVLKEVVALKKLCEFADFDPSTVDIVETVLDAAGKLAKEEIGFAKTQNIWDNLRLSANKR